MSYMGRFAMTQRELQRVQVLTLALEGQLPLKRAAETLGVSCRQASRLKASLAAQGPPGLMHGNVGRSPPNRLDEATRAKILELAEHRYAGFNDVHLAEMLAEQEGIRIGRETLRRLLRSAGRPAKRRRRPKKHHRRRERSPSKGLMLLWDGSPHRWFGPDRPACTLMAAIDDADNEVPFALFCQEETSAAYLELLRGILRRRGIPVSIYMDRHAALKRNDPHWSLEEQLAGKRNPTQVGQALEELGIKTIFAMSAQAKGRVERLFQTLQDRLIAELDLAGVHSIEEGNHFLCRKFLSRYNKRFQRRASNQKTCYRSARGLDLKRILSFRYPSIVANDNTISVGGLTIQIPKDKTGRGFAKARVDVRQHLDGSWSVYYQDKRIARAKATPLTEPLRYRRKSSKKKTKGAFAEVLLYSPTTSPDQCDIFAGQIG
jgi:transposase